MKQISSENLLVATQDIAKPGGRSTLYKQCLLPQKQSCGGEKLLLNSWVLKVSIKGVSKILSLFGKSRLGIGKKYKSEIIFTGELVMTMALTSLSESVLNLPGLFVLFLPTLPLLVGIL